MIRYPNLVAALDGADLAKIARRARLDPQDIQAWASGHVAPATPEYFRKRLARALRAKVDELFSLGDELESAMPAGADRYITDPATLRNIDRQAS